MGKAQLNFRAKDMKGKVVTPPPAHAPKVNTETPEPTPESSSKDKPSVSAQAAPKKGTSKGAGTRGKAAAPVTETPTTNETTNIKAEGVEHNG